MSVLKISSIENTAGTKYMDGRDFVRGTARAFVSYQPFTSPGPIRSSCNVLAFSFIGVGIMQVNFTVPFRTATYGMAGASTINILNEAQITQPFIEIEDSRTNKGTTYCVFETLIEASGAPADVYDVQVFFIGD